MSDQVMHSTILDYDVPYRVYLPPCYSVSQRSYPTLIMLHGQGEDQTQWDQLGIGQAVNAGYVRGALPPMIIVMPYGGDTEYGHDTSPFPDIIADELVPEIEAKFCTWNERFARGIGGISRGGYWAYWIALNHPELFSRVGGHSPFFYQPEDSTENNPFRIVDSTDRIEALAMYFDMGGDDLEVDEGLHNFVQHLQARGIEPTYVVNPVGGHSADYWRAHTADYLAFYADGWPRSVSQFPACEKSAP